MDAMSQIEAEREDLHALIAAVKKQVNAEFRLRMKKEIECNVLCTFVVAMERQEPVGEIQRANSTGNYICSEVWVPLPVGSKLFAGAKGEGK